MIIKNLTVNKENTTILNDLNIEFEENKIHILMGQNGSGKSTLVNTIAGHPDNNVISGSIIYNNIDILNLEIYKRALEGIYLSPQYPPVIEGLSHAMLLKHSLNAKLNYKNQEELDDFEFLQILKKLMQEFEFDSSYTRKSLNSGFSGGEKKRNEILQINLLNPNFVFLDEIDSGLDIDSMQKIAKFIIDYKNKGNTVVVITHYPNFAQLLNADYYHLMKAGKIVKSGDISILNQVLTNGFKDF